jgi:hypothetical protein
VVLKIGTGVDPVELMSCWLAAFAFCVAVALFVQ